MRIACLILPLALAACDAATRRPAQADQPAWSGPVRTESEPTGRLDRTHAGSPAPKAAFEDPDGGPASLADFRGRPVLVNLWATWCAPCIAEMPTLDALAARESGRLRVVALSQDLGGREKVDDFFAARRFERLEPYVDREMAILAELEGGTLPITILYDSEGRELWRMVGMEDWQSERAAALIAEAFPA